ncbi:hypothetical protein ONZ45_g3084 [Pleurotus djamor]|nr:hypothetical protein ONZ45_g3084 [Pleurotus djamor]
MADQPSDAANATSQSTIPGRINWWRFYRFPAIPAPRPQAAATSPPQSPTIPTPPPPTSETPFNNVAAPSTSSSDTPNPSETPASPPPPPTNPPMVIPVVVVGLQSVNTPPTWQPEPSPDEEFLDEGATPGDPDDTPLSHVQEPDPNALPGSADPFNRNVRGRSWHARAANVLRNLRPGGRRSPSPHPRPPSDALGSRTFLIYVIGGYYPPDHNIVTQTFNDFDSFEALLELAELLGQVKPPTVSKEEIEKSNLEIIPASRLSEFEQSGKISSNCVDRCLVCLDDYAPEDNVRVMTCKHAFHKDCVDRWLQTGRNNCPACRSKGIHTEGTPAAAV